MEEELERKYTRGEYLGFFANHLVGIGKGTRIEKEDMDIYSFNIQGINKLILELEIGVPDYFHSHSYDITLRGPESQLKKFIERAGMHFRTLSDTKKGIEEQTQAHEDREYKEWYDKREKEQERHIKEVHKRLGL